jgi:hypothetical protein
MFRAILRSSSGGYIVLLQHLVSSLSVNGRIVRRLRADSRLSLWKWVPGISLWVKAADAYGWRPTTLVVPNVNKIRGLNLPGTPWATSACCGMTFTVAAILNIRLDWSVLRKRKVFMKSLSIQSLHFQISWIKLLFLSTDCGWQLPPLYLPVHRN